MPAGKRSERRGRTKLPEIDLDELKKFKEQNFRERLEFLDWYAEWVKNSSNAKWSSAQNTGKPVGKKEYKKIIKELDDLREKYW